MELQSEKDELIRRELHRSVTKKYRVWPCEGDVGLIGDANFKQILSNITGLGSCIKNKSSSG
jgi:hypothetical protein